MCYNYIISCIYYLVITGNINKTTENLEKELTIIIYLEKISTSEDIEKVKTALNSMDGIGIVEYKSKDEWKLEMSKYNSSFGTVLKIMMLNHY